MNKEAVLHYNVNRTKSPKYSTTKHSSIDIWVIHLSAYLAHFMFEAGQLYSHKKSYYTHLNIKTVKHTNMEP